MRKPLLIAALALVFTLACGGSEALANGPWAVVMAGADGGFSAISMTNGDSSSYTDSHGGGLVLEPGYVGFECYDTYFETSHNWKGVSGSSWANGGVLAMSSGGDGNVSAEGEAGNISGVCGDITLPGFIGHGGTVSVVHVTGSATGGSPIIE